MASRRSCFVAWVALAGCARIVGLDELREERNGLRAMAGQDGDAAAPSAASGLAPSGPTPGVRALEPDAEAPGNPSEVPPTPALLDGPPVRLSIAKIGTGSIVSEPAGIVCGATCSAEFPAGTVVTLEAVTENGSGSIFSFWGGEASCSSQHRCVLPALTRDLEVNALFRSPFNPIFASSVRVSPTLGGIREYDRVCNELANRAGFNGGLIGDFYVAVMSDSLNSFRARLGAGPSNFELVDGSQFATSAFALFEQDMVLRSVDLDENGNYVSDDRERRYLTGTLADGSPSPDNCNGWTDPSLSATAGLPAAGPGSWLMGDTVSCAEPQHVLCVSARAASTASLPEPGVRTRIWVSKTRFVPGSTTPDQHCALSLPPGVVNARALISYTDRPARELLSLGGNGEYVRPDGMIVGVSDDIVGYRTNMGFWQAHDSTYLSPYRAGTSPDVWTGQTDFDRVGSPESTCNDWRQTTGVGVTGRYDVHRRGFWGELDPVTGSSVRSVSCADPGGAHLYCVGTPF